MLTFHDFSRVSLTNEVIETPHARRRAMWAATRGQLGRRGRAARVHAAAEAAGGRELLAISGIYWAVVN